MPKRYFCDFCNKSFADNPVARKNHMNGVFHQKNRKLHYDSFRDPEIILFEEKNKKPCKHFMQSGMCNFVENCRFSHLREEDLEKLTKQVLDQKQLGSNASAKKNAVDFSEDKFRDFMRELQTKQIETTCESNDADDKCENSGVVLPTYNIPNFFQNVLNLPPSLLPPPPDSFLTLPLEEWGHS